MKINSLLIGSILGGTAVLLGALGAHALKASLSIDQLQSFETAVRYQMYHALIIIVVGLLNKSLNSKLLGYSNLLFLLGTLLFSGSIYLLSTKGISGFENINWLGPITPIGGLLLIIGWAFLIVEGLKKAKK